MDRLLRHSSSRCMVKAAGSRSRGSSRACSTLRKNSAMTRPRPVHECVISMYSSSCPLAPRDVTEQTSRVTLVLLSTLHAHAAGVDAFALACYTYIHTYIHTYVHACMHAYSLSLSRPLSLSLSYTYANAYRSLSLIHIRKCIPHKHAAGMHTDKPKREQSRARKHERQKNRNAEREEYQKRCESWHAVTHARSGQAPAQRSSDSRRPSGRSKLSWRSLTSADHMRVVLETGGVGRVSGAI